MKLLKMSVYRRVMAAFIAAIILLYAFSIIMYQRSISSIKKQLVESIEKSESNYFDIIEQNVEKVKELTFASALKQDWSLLSTKRGYINDYDTLQVVLYAQERLQAIRNSSFVVEDAKANFASWGRTISAESGLIDLKTDEFNNVRMPLDAAGAQFIYFNDGLYLTNTYQYTNPVAFSIVIKLSLQKITLSLSNLNVLNGSNTMLLRSDTGKILAASNVNKLFDNALNMTNRLKGESGNFTLNINGTKYICIYDSSKYLGLTVVNITPVSELYKSLTLYYSFIWLFSCIVILIIVIYIYYTYKSIGKPMNVLIKAFKHMGQGNFDVRVKNDENDDFAYLYDSFDHMAANIKNLINEIYEKEILVQRANLKQLQTQINPHFLYNSFYILHRMIKLGDNENAESFSAYLGKYFKYITRNASDEVPLSMEVDHAKNYADIMSIRVGNVVRIEFGKIPENYTELIVPRLILQPIIENAFEHGIKGLLNEGFIQINFTEENEDLIITVEDNGVGMSYEDLMKINELLSNSQTNGEITGIINIHRRIKLMYGEGYGLSIASGDFEGTSITLRLKNIRRN